LCRRSSISRAAEAVRRPLDSRLAAIQMRRPGRRKTHSANVHRGKRPKGGTDLRCFCLQYWPAIGGGFRSGCCECGRESSGASRGRKACAVNVMAHGPMPAPGQSGAAMNARRRPLMSSTPFPAPVRFGAGRSPGLFDHQTTRGWNLRKNRADFATKWPRHQGSILVPAGLHNQHAALNPRARHSGDGDRNPNRCQGMLLAG